MKKMVLFLAIGLVTSVTLAAEVVLFDAERSDAANHVVTLDGAKSAVRGGVLEIATTAGTKEPGVLIKGSWSIAGVNELRIEFAKVEGKEVPSPMHITLLSKAKPYALAYSHERKRKFGLTPKFQLPVPLGAKALKNHEAITGLRSTPFNMLAEQQVLEQRPRGVGGGTVPVLAADLSGVKLSLNAPIYAWRWGVRRIVATVDPARPTVNPKWVEAGADAFFPFIDRYGQFKFGEWPGKVHSDAELIAAREAEAKDLAAHPGPKGWSRFGGWADGPKLRATGHFRVEKVRGKWWLVDPDGFLFWSHGPVRVTTSTAVTPLRGRADRTRYFEELPPRSGSPFSLFYETNDALLAPYYPKWNWKETYDFSSANCFRKYGVKWFETFADLAHRRLRSWGCNTIANSSDARIYALERTPFIERIEVHSKPVGDYRHGWWPIPDPFEPDFEKELNRQLALFKKALNSPWCIGVFVDNEHAWGDSMNMAVQTLRAPADQAAKRAMVTYLRNKFGEVSHLNQMWKTTYSSWDALLASTVVPDRALAETELKEFTSALIGKYYAVIAKNIKNVAPNTMYMGCRFAGGLPEHVIRPGLAYQSVISVNRYARDIGNFRLPAGIDMPIIIGEFHFGALDRGMFHPGLIHLKSQQERGEVYKQYVRSALRNPQCIGVHWHQFGDQATSGRFCGENFQVGFVDCCDSPYPETRAALRVVGADLYEYRMGGK